MEAVIDTLTTMSLAEAQKCVADIKAGIAYVRQRVWELYSQEGWRALGYRNWQECKECEFGTSSRHVERLLAAARVEQNIIPDATRGSYDPLPERVLRPLTPLEPDQQRDVWSTVLDDHPNGGITGASVQEAVDRATGRWEPTEEYREFEKEELLPHLHDAGLPESPQILAGECDEPEPVPDEQQERAEASLREAIIEQLEAYKQGRDADECADDILEALSQGHHSLAIAARMGVALSLGPQTLTDLVAMAARTCGKDVHEMDRPAYLRMRKRVLRLVDAVTYSGLGIYQHELANNQICFGLMGR